MIQIPVTSTQNIKHTHRSLGRVNLISSSSVKYLRTMEKETKYKEKQNDTTRGRIGLFAQK